MKKQDLLKKIDREMLDKMYGFCYSRTRDCHDAEDLCSDIVLAVAKASSSDGEVDDPYAYIWRIARNVYADFSEKRAEGTKYSYIGNPEEALSNIAETDEVSEDDEEKLSEVFRRIAFLSRAYREVMIAFYLDGKTIAQIAQEQNASANAVKQRLFSARQTIKSEVAKMEGIKNKPISLDQIEFNIWGTGNPEWGDPRRYFTRQLSKQVVWACREKPKTAKELSDMMNVPTVYIEDELEQLVRGANGEYGLLRRLESGRYALNFILLDREQADELYGIYLSRVPFVSEKIADYVLKNKDRYLAFPYLNRKVDFNLVLWQQIFTLSDGLQLLTDASLKSRHFSEVKRSDRPFTVYGHADNGKYYGAGWDGSGSANLCGYSFVTAENIYNKHIKRHFDCGINVSNDRALCIAIRAIKGMDINELAEDEKEGAASAIDQGYVYREGDMLYTKILVSDGMSRDELFRISREIRNDPSFILEADRIADQVAAFIRKNVPKYLMRDYLYVNDVAALPVRESVADALIEKGLLMPPENGVGAEGCWLQISK